MIARLLLASIAAAALAACSSGNDKASAKTPAGSAAAPIEKAAPAIVRPDAEGKVEITATADGFVPSRIEAEGGKPLKLVFTRKVEKSCMTAVVFPSLEIEKDLPLDEPVEIELTPEAGATIAFQCPMGMGRSTIVGLPNG